MPGTSRSVQRFGPRAVAPPRAWPGKTPGVALPRVRRIPLHPGPDNPEPTSTSEGLRLVPLETHDRRAYRPREEGVEPPWDKGVYHDPESEGS